MADEPNIDDILKSIDALLKEGVGGDDSEQKNKRRRDTAINDDEIAAAEVEATQSGIGGDEVGDALQDSQDEQDLAKQHEDELQQAADAADMDDHPTNLPVEDDTEEADTEEMDAPPEAHPARRRILLSEDMLVEHTPDLPLASVPDAEPDEGQAEESQPDQEQPDEGQTGDDNTGVELTEAESVFVQGEPSALEDIVEPEFESVAEPPFVDREWLIEQITTDIHARLQAELPDILSEWVAEAVNKHVSGKAEPSLHQDNESSGDI
jgi:hypothetical protein